MIEQGQLPLDDVIKRLESQATLWLRIVATRTDDEWHESLMEVTSGVVPPQWAERRWEYHEAIFVSVESTGPEVANWFRAGIATIGSDVVKLPLVPEQQNLSWHRLGSKQVWGLYEPLDWPYENYDLAYGPLKAGPGSGSFISHDSPSFVRFAVAAASFFGVSLPTGGSTDSIAPMFRLQDCSGRIGLVRLGAAELEVHVQGNGLSGMIVELASDNPGPTMTLSDERSQVAKFPLPNGLPSGAWVVLKRGSDWIDRKFINWPNTMSPDPGIEFVVEPMTQLEALVASGEGPGIEFKQEVPERPEARRKVSRTFAAFANGDGGHVLFGVDDDGNVIGLPAEAVTQAALDAVTGFIRSLVAPLPDFSVECIPIDDGSGRGVIVVTMKQGEATPYGVGPENPNYYIRRGATTFPAGADEARALARSRPPADQNNGGLFGHRLGL